MDTPKPNEGTIRRLHSSLANARLKYIRAILRGVESGDDWFREAFEDIKRQWPELVRDEIQSRAYRAR